MTVLEELVMTLFDEALKEKVSKIFLPDFEFNGHRDRMPIANSDMTCRLFKPTPHYVNFEFLASSDHGRCFQPVALFDQKLNILLLNEYFPSYKNLKANGGIIGQPHSFDIKTNALVAAFSMRTVGEAFMALQDVKEKGWEPEFSNGRMIPAAKRYDQKLVSNGLNCELLFCFEGYPQFYLDDEYDLEGPLAAYMISEDDRIQLAPMIEYKKQFDHLDSLKLLTAFTRW